jgi:N-acetylglucosaminyldiphosphoundecaprenol N-acetyl-beta-D-mannosaminyltransferase
MKVRILGVEVDNLSFDETLDKIEDFLKDGKQHYIVTPNPEIIMLAQKDTRLRKILNNADLAIPDGIGLVWASKLLSSQFTVHSLKKKNTVDRERITLKQRVTGVDLADKLCELAAEKGFAIGFLGGGPGVAEKAAECQKKKYRGLKVAFAKGSNPENAVSDIKKAISLQFTVNRSQKNTVNREAITIDLLLVAYGAPKQEYWIAGNLSKVPVKIAFAVGGALDYFAGKQIRAPKIIQDLGFEWFWRLILEPWRIKRQMALLVFVFLVVKEALVAKS